MMLALLLLAAADPAGWSNARWGMTEDQVLKAFPNRAARLAEPIPSCTILNAKGERKEAAPIAIEKVPIGTTEYRACFYFTAGKLSSVDLQPLAEADKTPDEFDRVEALLVEKYGKPWQSRDKFEQASRWAFQTTRIALLLFRFELGDFKKYSLTLRYSHKTDPDNL